MTAVDPAPFLTARLDEDEAAAKAAVPGPWRWGDWSATFGTPEVERGTLEHSPEQGPFPGLVRREIKTTRVLSLMDSLEIDPDQEASALHIARHDPARVLREVAAMRRIMERHHDDGCGYCAGCETSTRHSGIRELVPSGECPEKRDLAAIWCDHAEYRGEWAVSPPVADTTAAPEKIWLTVNLECGHEGWIYADEVGCEFAWCGKCKALRTMLPSSPAPSPLIKEG
jgi:hypothetical protein